MNLLISLFIIIFFGLLFGKIVKIVKFPEVTGYLLAGIFIGPYVFKFISFEQINNLNTFSIIALTFISFMIGAEFKWSYVKKVGKNPFIIGAIASILTMALVTICTFILGYSISFSLLLGAIASSTAPAAILMIVKEYNAKGEVTNAMLSVIAIDDIISMVLFGFSFAIANYLNVENSTLLGLLNPFKEIFLSIIIGGIIGFILGYLSKLFKNDSDIVCLIIAFTFLLMIICDYFDISSMLTAMIMGIIFVNLFKVKLTDHILDLVDYITPPILIIFFVASGASLDFSLLSDIGLLGLGYILMRSVGKIYGAMLGSKIVKSSKNVTKYLGPTLLSQTGLPIGLATVAVTALTTEADSLITVVIATSFIFDVFGPILAKISLKKAKEI